MLLNKTLKETGLLFLNSGKKNLPRLLVAIDSLREHTNIETSLISISESDENKYCENICQYYNISLINLNQKLFFKHHYWFEKARIHLYSPYKYTIFLDSDILILQNFDELFNDVVKHEFVATQFADWTTKTRRIIKRLSQWNDTNKDLVKETIESNVGSVNVGVYGFSKQSTLMHNWFDFTITHPTANLPEETSCQLLLHKYPGYIAPNIYNASCKFHNLHASPPKILHYHGRKHCVKRFNGDLWLNRWVPLFKKNVCNIQQWYLQCQDIRLNHFMGKNYVR